MADAIESPTALMDYLVAVLHHTRHTLDVLTHDLELAQFGDDAVMEELKRIMIGTRAGRVRVLVMDTTRARVDGHPWVRLAQKLESRMYFRVPGQDHQDRHAAFVIGDDMHWLYRPLATRYEGESALNDRRGARLHVEWFKEAWEFARPASELMRLAL